MFAEIAAATHFLVGLLRPRVDAAALARFAAACTEHLHRRFVGHWQPADPRRGSAYRCLRCVPGKLDPALRALAAQTGLPLGALLPPDFALWIDPADVAYRFGDSGLVGRVTLPPAAVAASSPAVAVTKRLHVAPASPAPADAVVSDSESGGRSDADDADLAAAAATVTPTAAARAGSASSSDENSPPPLVEVASPWWGRAASPIALPHRRAPGVTAARQLTVVA